MDKELHLHKRVDICAEQTIYKLRQLSDSEIGGLEDELAAAGAKTHYRSRRERERERELKTKREQQPEVNRNNSNWQQLRRGVQSGEAAGGGEVDQCSLRSSMEEHILNFKLSAGKLRHI